MLDVDIVGDEHIRREPVSILSFLSPYSGLILAIVLIILYLVKQYLLESFLLRKCYGAYFTDLNESNRRGFVNHHVAGAVKLIILCAGVYPFVSVAFRNAILRTPYAHGSKVQMGDVLVVAAQILSGMYVFELVYRVRISYVSAMHHIGAILVAQAVIAISLTDPPERDAGIEFILCTVWGEWNSATKLRIQFSRFFPPLAPPKNGRVAPSKATSTTVTDQLAFPQQVHSTLCVSSYLTSL